MLVQEFVRQAQAQDRNLLVIVGHCNAYTGAGDPYLPFREALALLAGEVEAKATDGWIRPDHVRRLEAALPVTLPALVEHAPELIGSFLPLQGLLARATALAPPNAPWLKQLAALGMRGQSVVLEERRIFAQYAAVLRAIAARHPLLLVLEDLHWIDLASSGLLFHLTRIIGESRILLVGTYRPDEVMVAAGREANPLAGMVAEFKRQHGDIWLDLGDTTTKEGFSFVNAYIDTEPNRLDAEFRTALFQHTGGHALFTAEPLRSLVARGDLRQDDEKRWVVNEEINWRLLPAKVEGVIERQLARLDGTARAVLHVACVQGENFTAEVIAKALQISEPVLVQLLSQELGRRQRLVSAQELTTVGRQRLSHYRFRHYLFQRYLYQSLDETERAYLHEAVGNALESLYGEQAPKSPRNSLTIFTRRGVWRRR
jgi:predicted ATPase